MVGEAERRRREIGSRRAWLCGETLEEKPPRRSLERHLCERCDRLVVLQYFRVFTNEVLLKVRLEF